MKNVLLQAAIKLNNGHKQKKWWQRAARVLTMVVVFCTTYALILPAITMEGEYVCGMEAHEHSESCYTQHSVYTFTCNLSEQVEVAHSHDTYCYDAQGELICLLPEIEGHSHDDSCYESIPVCEAVHTHSEECITTEEVLICTEEERVGHTHSGTCTKTEQLLICTEEECEGHTHSGACTGTERVLICTEEEHEGHGDSGAKTEQVLICTNEDAEHSHDDNCYEIHQAEPAEHEGHTHSEACYETREVTCELAESEGHTHSEACYEIQEVTCERTEDAGHTHSEACYEIREIPCELTVDADHVHDESCCGEESQLVCGRTEMIPHQHTESCRIEGEPLMVLVCELPEHTHEDSCYPLEEEDEELARYLCGSGVHAHGDGCYDEEGNLTCTIPEHDHEAACLVADLDLNADVETREDWEQTLEGLTLTGNWARDILAVADSQLGYTESEKNVILEDGQLKGYTRYGAWYGLPYGNWCAMFASFCLDYAGVEDFPLESSVIRWIETLTEQELYAAPGEYTPEPGDLIFFDFDRKSADAAAPIDADHVGIVVEQIPATDEDPAKIRTIEGNTGNKVAYVTYELDDPAIIGYGKMPVGELIILEYQGADFAVTVKVGADAGIPENAQLAVREIARGTDEYNTYYQQSVEALIGQNSTAAEVTEEDLNVSFARFFDITFLVDGEAVEPAAPAEVQIRYADSFTVEEGNAGKVVHFAQDGTEVLNADTNHGEANEADTFNFVQGSFSVSGTLVLADARAASNVAYKVNFSDVDNFGSDSEYILYTQYNGQYYALGAPASGKTGVLVPITVGSDGTITWTATGNIRWSFEDTGTNTYNITNEISSSTLGRHLHVFYNGNGSDVGVIGTNSKGAMLSNNGNGTFKIKHPSSNAYATISGNTFTATNNNYYGYDFYIAKAQPSVYHVWFDGTVGGMMSYYGAEDSYQAVDPANNTITLPTTWKSSTKYDYTLNGWYDINSHTYYQPGEEVTITQHTVFYADWVAATYDVGQDNEHVVDSLDTRDFITTYVFDYNALFNVLSQTHTGTITATDHSETWTVYNNGETVPYQDGKSLGFVFVDYDSPGEFSYANDRDVTNTNQGDEITPGILQEVENASGQDLLDLLFNPAKDVIGKYYVGTGNYLYQYMDSTTENYDGEHNGYYYLDARLNAASYNQSLQRFYLYDYLERTSDSRKDGYMNPDGQYSDLLPFNSPYLFEADQLDNYTDSILRSGYEYDAKDGGTNHPEYNSLDDANTNYFFGIRSDIEFFLPNDSGTQDEYGNYGNISTRGEHMVFDFHGDDDVWVFIDDELVLDIGGLHGIMHGRIDFSTGTVTSGRDGGTEVTQTFQEILGHNIGEGTHTMQVYYMERGSSQANCAIYFNIAPRYDLEIRKEDIVSEQELNGAVFQIFTCEDCANTCLDCVSGTCEIHKTAVPACEHYTADGAFHVAQLWDTKAAHEEDMKDGTVDDDKSTFTVEDGVAKCWGISAGKTYYIREITPPPGYPASDDLIRITLNNRGTATIETTTLHGANGVATEGFAVVKQEVNNTLKIVALTVTNQKEGDTTEIRVQKTWAAGSENLPQSITVYLTADGVPVGRRATLNEANGWAYTWTGLPKYAEDGIDQEIVYEVQEVLVPNYITTQGSSVQVEQYEDWIKVDQMSDSKTYLLVHNGQALSYNGSFGWMDPETAKTDSGAAAQWAVTTDHDGFHLKNGLGYTLTFNPSTSSFYGIDNDAIELNQVIYYLNSRLVVHDNDIYYQFGANGTSVSEDGLAFTLYQQEIFTGWMTGITNTPVEEENQTYVEVNKVWKDGNENHTGDSVTIRLYADGTDTGRTIVLDASNNWTGGFYDLSYYKADGITKIQYTVEEEPVYGYVTVVGDPTTLAGLPVILWQNASSITPGGTYRFTSGSYAMAVNTSGDVVAVTSDLDDTSQQWLAEANYYGSVILKNVDTGVYLTLSNNSLVTTTNKNSASVVTMTGEGYARIGSRYLEVGPGYAQTTGNTQNISGQKITYQVQTTGKEGTGYTVTNLPAIAVLPNTGGMGTSLYTFSGLLILAAALMYVITFGRKRQKGGV